MEALEQGALVALVVGVTVGVEAAMEALEVVALVALVVGVTVGEETAGKVAGVEVMAAAVPPPSPVDVEVVVRVVAATAAVSRTS